MGWRSKAKAAIIICRWGSWPAWFPLVLRSIEPNRDFSFLLISDVRPDVPLPRNVHYHAVSLADLVERFRKAIPSFTLAPADLEPHALLHLRGGITMSAAKINDLKPMLGLALSDILAPYKWWGWVQEDVVLGNLSACVPSSLLSESDVISPRREKAIGTFMLFRNNESVNNAWRKSRDHARVVSDPDYMIFDEGWGKSHDALPIVLGREAHAGALRIANNFSLKQLEPRSPGAVRLRAFADDSNDIDINKTPLLLCWDRGSLYLNLRNGPERHSASTDYVSMPCLGAANPARRAYEEVHV